jgi:hypothetical protein
LFRVYPIRKHRAAAAVVLTLALALQCFDLRAELLFRGVEVVNGEQRWLPIRKYSNPSDTAYARATAWSAPVPAEEVHVFINGTITREDVDSARVLAGLIRSGKQRIAGNAVWLTSDGGEVDAAMDLGRLFRMMGVDTLIGKNDQCLSSCVFAFMGGERRSVVGRLGIHRPFFSFTQEIPDRRAHYRHLQQRLKAYIDEMDFPASLYDAMMAVPPESMEILAPADLKRLYLEGISPSSEDLADAAAARRLDIPMTEYLKRKANAPACASLLAGQDRCELKP